jgi:RNA polymerase sigma-70 factor (ECF subfamily)
VKGYMLKAAQEGDMDAFARLFEEYRGMMHAVAVGLAGADDADDIVMNSFLKAWQALPRFRRRASLKTWLYRIVRNCALDTIRKRQRHAHVSLSGDDTACAVERDVEDCVRGGPDEVAARRDLTAVVQKAMQRLSMEHNSVLTLRYVDGLQYNEIAVATGVSIGTVMSRLFHARRRLRALVEME